MPIYKINFEIPAKNKGEACRLFYEGGGFTEFLKQKRPSTKRQKCEIHLNGEVVQWSSFTVCSSINMAKGTIKRWVNSLPNSHPYKNHKLYAIVKV